MMEVRLLTENDIDEITELRILEQYEYHNKGKDPIFEERMKQYVLNHTGKDLFSFGVIENNEIVSIASFLVIDYAPSIGSVGKELYIFNVYTKPLYRRKGYAKKVLIFGIDYFKKLNYTCFRLHTNNENAKKLYLHLGFHQSTTSMSLFTSLGGK